MAHRVKDVVETRLPDIEGNKSMEVKVLIDIHARYFIRKTLFLIMYLNSCISINILPFIFISVHCYTIQIKSKYLIWTDTYGSSIFLLIIHLCYHYKCIKPQE